VFFRHPESGSLNVLLLQQRWSSMVKKARKRKDVPWALIALLVILALAAGYYIGTREQKQPPTSTPGIPEADLKQQAMSTEPEIPRLREKIPGVREGFRTGSDQDTCRKLQEDLKDFFEYLNHRPYVQQIEQGMDTREWFHRILAKLAAAPPLPAGEGLDPAAMANHIFYFFRTLETKEMRLLKNILLNEASTLEANLDLFFRWLFQQADCPETVGARPSPGVLYDYAGFFLNTIGGRAYLSRSSQGVQDLVTYYCLLILNDADKRGKNVYGINIAPQVRALSREMAYRKDLLYQKEYLKQLEQLEKFYAGR
jgi:hypothetical protein